MHPLVRTREQGMDDPAADPYRGSVYGLRTAPLKYGRPASGRRLVSVWRAGGAVTYRFGDFSLNRDRRQLLFAADEVHLTPKAFDLLDLLLANRARAMSKSELQELMWPSTFVEETNLAGLVAEIRRALRDCASKPRFLRTLYGFGYQFVGDVRVEATAIRVEQARSRMWLTCDGRQIPLLEGENVLGRAADAAIQIGSPGVSRYHARIVVADGEATLTDLGSKNGTIVAGSRLTAPYRLSDGDEIRLGTALVTFRSSSPTSLTETVG